ncbi:RNA polymerase I associated factor, A49-like protein [Meredithblackwellia eburnea MCA 4105]
MSSSPRKKQKGSQGQAINVEVAAQDEQTLSPVLALFPATKPPSSTPFAMYRSVDGAQTVLAAETKDMEFESRNHRVGTPSNKDGQSNGEETGYSAEYMLGVHDPRTNTLTLHPAPLHTFQPTVKATKGLHSTSNANSLFIQQKAALGTAFGTKKAIRAINAQARNKLDATSFGSEGGLESFLTQSIASTTELLPTLSAVEDAANASRPIPPFVIDAATPGAVYPLETVVSRNELAAIKTDPFMSAEMHKDRIKLLPYKRSQFVHDHIRSFVASGAAGNKTKLRLTIHFSHLMAFRQFAGFGREIDFISLKEKMKEVDEASIMALVERFTEKLSTGQGETRKMTDWMQMKLLSYLLVVALKIDGEVTDVNKLAEDLEMGVPKVQELFKSLGCTIIAPSTEERALLVRSGRASNDVEARKCKRAVLRVPLEFPKERRGKAKK